MVVIKINIPTIDIEIGNIVIVTSKSLVTSRECQITKINMDNWLGSLDNKLLETMLLDIVLVNDLYVDYPTPKSYFTVLEEIQTELHDILTKNYNHYNLFD